MSKSIFRIVRALVGLVKASGNSVTVKLNPSKVEISAHPRESFSEVLSNALDKLQNTIIDTRNISEARLTRIAEINEQIAGLANVATENIKLRDYLADIQTKLSISETEVKRLKDLIEKSNKNSTSVDELAEGNYTLPKCSLRAEGRGRPPDR